MDKKALTERDICTKYITPALAQAGWDTFTQVLEEFPLTKGRIIVRGRQHTRAQNKRADYVLFYKPNIPLAVIEAKDNNHSLGDGTFAIAFIFKYSPPQQSSSAGTWCRSGALLVLRVQFCGVPPCAGAGRPDGDLYGYC